MNIASIDSIKSTDGDILVKILTGQLIEDVPVYGGGVVETYVPLALNYTPAVKVFFKSDKFPNRMFTTPVSIFDPGIATIWSDAALFTMIWIYEKQNNRLLFSVTNRDSEVRRLTAYYHIFDARGVS